MSTPFRLTVVIAEEYAEANLNKILSAIDPASHPEVEYILCSASKVLGQVELKDYKNLRFLHGSGRIPLLWRDGILAAKADKVALTTAHCIPASNWINRLLQIRLHDNVVAVGGAISNAKDACSLSWAIYLLRYFSFRPQKQAREVAEIAADNSVYCRSAILQHKDLLQSGFWEPSFHKRFRNEGLVLRFDPSLIVHHENRYGTQQFLRQRIDHGTAFGSDRAADMNLRKLLFMSLLSPAIPLVFFGKILRTVREDSSYYFHTIKCIPLLFFFVCGWSLGESKAYILALSRKLAL